MSDRSVTLYGPDGNPVFAAGGAALGDTMNNPTAPAVGAHGMVFNPTSGKWERLRGDGSGGVRASLYGKQAAAGDTPIAATAAGLVKVAVGSSWSPVDGRSDQAMLISDNTDTGRPFLTVLPYGWNGSSWDRMRGNERFTLLASAARTGDATTADLTNYNGVGLSLVVDVTAKGTPAGQISNINVQVKATSGYKTLHQFAAVNINDVGIYAFLIYPATLDAGSWTQTPIKGRLPRLYRVVFDHANESDSLTYEVVASHLL